MASNQAGGKGSAVRPSAVSKEEFGNNWEAIFGKKRKEEPMDTSHCLYLYAIPLKPPSVEVKDRVFSMEEATSFAMMQKEDEQRSLNTPKEVCGTCDDTMGTRCGNPLMAIAGDDGHRQRKVTPEQEACGLHRQTT